MVTELNHLLSLPIKFVPNAFYMANRMCFQAFRAYHKAVLQKTIIIADRTITKYPDTETDRKTGSVFFDTIEDPEILPGKASPTIPAIDNPAAKNLPVLWESNFEEITRNKHIINDPFNAWLEKFVKVTINYKIDFEKLIPVPTKSGAVEYYKIHRKIASNGLLAFALTPAEKTSSLSPIIVFRATETDIFAEEGANSMHNDLDPHLGEPGWEANKEEFKKLMEDPSFKREGQKIKVAGYSLGGVHAQYCILENLEHVSHGVFYNNPSAHSAVADAFAEKIQNTPREKPLLLQIFRTLGDPFHHFGEKHIGCGVDHPNLVTQLFEVEYPNQSMFDLTLHSRRIFDTFRFDYKITEYTEPESLKVLLDNSQRDPITTSLEKGRKIFGKALSFCLSAFTSAVFFLLGLFGLKIHRTHEGVYVIRKGALDYETSCAT